MPGKPRKRLNPKARDFKTRFSIHLRKLVDERGLTEIELHKQLHKAGLKVSRQAIRKWLSAYRVPTAEDMEKLAGALGLAVGGIYPPAISRK